MMEIKTDQKKNVFEPSLTFTTQRKIPMWYIFTPICCSDLVIVMDFMAVGSFVLKLQ